jgi:outer membrane protein assembly factor BamA
MKSSLIIVFLCFFGFSLSQKSYKLVFINDDYLSLKKKVNTEFKDSVAAKKYLKEFKSFAINKGYVLASLDSMFYKKNSLSVYFYLGEKFTKTHLTIDKEDLNFIQKRGGISEKFIRNINFSPKEISVFLKQVQAIYENNAYPFVKIYLDKISIENNELFAKLIITKNKEFRIKKINLVGNPLVSPKMISSYIQIKEGDFYRQERINEISSKIAQISFISEIKPAELLFTNEGVEIFLYLKAKPVSLVNGVIGLQPDPIKNKLNLTGEFRLKLVNILKKAEYFDLNWRNIQAQTQSLKMQGLFPNLFSSSFGIDGNFNLYKRDSTFLELKSTLGVQYALRQGNFLKAFYRRNSSSILAGGTNSTSFQNLKSVETNFYGISLSKQNLDYLPNPRKGIQFYIEATIGSRKTIDSLLGKNETTAKFELNFNYYFPLAKRHVIKFGNFTESYFAPSYFQNEVYRYGGQTTMRGFNEEELYATSRTVFTLEYRFLLDQNSFLFTFYDQSWYENKSLNFITDTPFGLGAGFAFGTNIGNFSISYAIGKQFDNLIQFREGKVHFGYISYF